MLISMRRIIIGLALAAAATVPVGAAKTLDIYFIDVEGGQSTLVVTPAGESLLIDSGFPGSGGFDAVPGDPKQARDANRIVAAARAAGLTRIDFFLNTHFHADHDGGIVELASLMPVGAFIDHGSPRPEAENVAGTLRMFDAYAKLRAGKRHLQPRPGDRLPLKGVEAIVVSALGETITAPLSGGGARSDRCSAPGLPAEEPNENSRSTGVRLAYGRFRFLDVGDLSGPPLRALACPASLVGPIDVYLVAHHGGPDAADPATFAAFAPRVGIVNNGARKGGVKSLLDAMRAVPTMEGWQLHRRLDAGDSNAPDERIANLDESAAHWLKISATDDGAFVLTNGRTGKTKAYPAVSGSSRKE
jgi:beta-lactamase superfamily II metal-dependent hydrolase